MDIGIFKAGKVRLIAWIVLPPVLITGLMLSSLALAQQADWKLRQTEALSKVLPSVRSAQQDVRTLIDNLGLSEKKRIVSEDQLIALLEQKAFDRDILVKTVLVSRRERSKSSTIPMLHADVVVSGDISSFLYYINDVKEAQPLIAATMIELNEMTGNSADEYGFELKINFELLLVDEVLNMNGGAL